MNATAAKNIRFRPGHSIRTARHGEQEHRDDALVPTISPFILHWFTWYSIRYLRKHFHGLRVSFEEPLQVREDQPIVFYVNHPAWWDALVCLVLKHHFFPSRKGFVPIDAEMLKKYSFFKKLGFFGVKQGSRWGAAQFLRTSSAILKRPGTILALTPQGRFVDPRERPIRFRSGIGHLVQHTGYATYIPAALEYSHWEERLPEVLVRFGKPMSIGHDNRNERSAAEWTTFFEQSLERTQNELARLSIGRDGSEFSNIMEGDAGQGGIYDIWRAGKAWLTGQTFRKEHGAL